jgi:exodeoxyribonuclease VII large subunit
VSTIRSSTAVPAEQRIFSVSELTAALKEVIEGTFPSVWVAGEISNFIRHGSGHCYLTLKDAAAQLRAVVWRSTAQRLPFELHDGLEVICRGSLDLYAPRGTYQLVIQQVQPKGMGALELALRRLRDKLAAEGLFDPRHKQPLPRFPRRVAFITSPTGAAIRDFLQVLKRRWRGVHLLVVPVRVQGAGAASEIAAAIAQVQRLIEPPDVIVVGRGGGSLEDLWSFNEEPLVRAIFAARIPVVSAVGHEIDVTLSDLVADVRALTPSEAAERVVPAADEVLANLNNVRRRLQGGLRQRFTAVRAWLDAVAARAVFRRPMQRVNDAAQRLDEWSSRAARAMRHRAAVSRNEVDLLAAQLESLSPNAVLRRGYSLTYRAADGRLVTGPDDAAVGERIVTRLAEGQLSSRVEQVGPATGTGRSN